MIKTGQQRFYYVYFHDTNHRSQRTEADLQLTDPLPTFVASLISVLPEGNHYFLKVHATPPFSFQGKAGLFLDGNYLSHFYIGLTCYPHMDYVQSFYNADVLRWQRDCLLLWQCVVLVSHLLISLFRQYKHYHSLSMGYGFTFNFGFVLGRNKQWAQGVMQFEINRDSVAAKYTPYRF